MYRHVIPLLKDGGNSVKISTFPGGKREHKKHFFCFIQFYSVGRVNETLIIVHNNGFSLADLFATVPTPSDVTR